MAKLNLEFGMSTIHVPLLNTRKADYERLKKRKKSSDAFKGIGLRYNTKKRIITVSHVRKDHATLNNFLKNSNYPGV